ncbi:MAG TPA: hypothetical protein VGN18_01605 [Jatrophihabitans sp.]|jgi:hypothetical protein|uniref:hypothetical protein n=1 Tax=Jatrophihabitans sp. TaxID=1932789 RepID=UPI002DFC496E|nr:hypothetical protein [Jatrophihabitans sp.]
MSVLGALDATRLCARWSEPTDPAAWARPVPTPSRPHRAAVEAWSWRSWARNPHALLLTGMVGTSLLAEAAVRAVR